jgi:glyoxylase-like metal-dependent hydrolase (beta-lactamase superfamily II)
MKMKTVIAIIAMVLVMSQSIAQKSENVITFRAGDFTVSLLSEGGGQGSGNMLKGATPEQLKKYLPDGTFLLETQVFLVRTPDKNILIDTGHGRNLFKNLQALGLDETQIQVILLTHLHGDHIGGLLRDGKIAFPNAEIYLSNVEYKYWNELGERGAAAQKALEAYKGKVHLFDPVEIGAASPDLLPGIQAIAAYGHTPGHTAFLIRSSEAKWLIWGDVTHAMPIQMPCPDVALSFDVDSENAIQTRKQVLEYAARNNITVGGMHIPFPAAGNVQKATDGAGYRFSPLSTCEGI